MKIDDGKYTEQEMYKTKKNSKLEIQCLAVSSITLMTGDRHENLRK